VRRRTYLEAKKEILMAYDQKVLELLRTMRDEADAAMERRRGATTEQRNAASTAATEDVGAAFVCGLLNGARGDAGVATIGPIPAAAAIGATCHLLSAPLGDDSDAEPHAAAIGTGALAGLAYRHGEQLGRSMRAAAAPAPFVAPAVPIAAAPEQPRGETFTVTPVGPPPLRRPR
jgi:hypothetical protein